jgi:CheY-like chemotaxis protein
MLRGAECDPDTLNEGLDTIERNANAQAQLIDDILDISRIITGKLRMNVGPTDLGPVVHEALDAVRPAADARGIRLKVHLDGGGGGGRSPAGALVSGDPVRLQQVVWNLLSNAIKFTPRGGTVSVTIDRAESRARIVVTDTGRGITPDFLPYVFDRFRQADASSTRRHGGLGLGLSIVRHLVELHGGTIDAHSDGEGKGATFTVALPLMAARPDFPPRATGHAEVGSSPPSPSSQPLPALECPPVLAGLRVLVVDDEPDARRLLAAVLGRCKAEVATAGGVAEALGEIDRARPHVLVSDIGMPDEDGYSLIRRVRQWDAAAGGHTPAIALTAYTRPADRVRVLSAGFQAYLPKPVEPAELVAAVASLAGRHMGAAGADGKAAGW